MSNRMPLALEDVLKNPIMSQVRDNIKDLVGMSILILPIVFNDEVLGTLFLRTQEEKNGFTKEIDFCRMVANASFRAQERAPFRRW
ncbi:MAG: GAF domain-containing protein [Deltaproteobacteria bacterium]|nr:GAF domain-containing protein [Deltaproteobacteria bacterium]